MKEVWVLVLRFFMLVSAVSSGSCLALEPRGRLGILGENVGSACEEFEDNEDGSLYYVNVSESRGTSPSGLSRRKGHKAVVVVCINQSS